MKRLAHLLFSVSLGTTLLGACASSPPVPVPPPTSVPPWTVIGVSVQGRPIEARTLGEGPYRIYLIGGIHGDEHEGGQWIGELCERLGPDELQGTTLRIVRDLNPDGTFAGTRGNARKIDLNRNWPASNFKPSPSRGPSPLSEPETRAVFNDLSPFLPNVVVVLHAARRGPFVNWDGPAEPLAKVFSEAAQSADARWRPVADMGYPTPGSIGSWIGKDSDYPVLTIEFERGGAPERARLALFEGIDALLATAAR